MLGCAAEPLERRPIQFTVHPGGLESHIASELLDSVAAEGLHKSYAFVLGCSAEPKGAMGCIKFTLSLRSAQQNRWRDNRLLTSGNIKKRWQARLTLAASGASLASGAADVPMVQPMMGPSATLSAVCAKGNGSIQTWIGR